MSISHLSFQVLGQIGPILSWVEGRADDALPTSWRESDAEKSMARRERDWFRRELPTYSYDNVDEIVKGTRVKHEQRKTKGIGSKAPPSLSPPRNYDLLDALRELNAYFLTWNGTEPCIRQQRMEELHELAIRFPAGHIVRHGHARAVAAGVLDFDSAARLPEQVTLLPSNSFGLRALVRRGLSESHLHLKAVIGGDESWAESLLKPLSVSVIHAKDPTQRQVSTLGWFAGGLLALAIAFSLDKGSRSPDLARRLLEAFDRLYFSTNPNEALLATHKLDDQFREALGEDVPERPRLEGQRLEDPEHRKLDAAERARRKETPRALSELLVGQHEFLRRWILRGAHLALLPFVGGRQRASAIETLTVWQDLIWRLHLAAHLRLVELSPPRPAPGAKKPDNYREDPRRFFLHEAFFRYLVCRAHHWQLATQQGTTPGLQRFRQYFSSPFRKISEIGQLRQASLTMGLLRQWHGLRVLEGRISPPTSPRDLVPWVLAFARSPDRRIQKFGLVVHFKKEQEEKEDRFKPGSSRGQPLRVRWGKRRRLLRQEAGCLYRILKRPTPVAPFIVGIDACNLELATPPEVFAPIFRFLRELPIPLSGSLSPHAPYLELHSSIKRIVAKRRLGMTYHVGEDFRHLLSGLRAIYEVIDFLRPQPGDRLGHATALGLQPQVWLEHNGYQAVMPTLEWLDTLVWVHHLLGPGNELIQALAIDERIQRLSWQVYSKAIADTYDPLGLDHRRRPPKPVEADSSSADGHRGLLDWDWSPLTLWDAWSLRQLDPYSFDLRALLRGELKMLDAGRRGGYTEEHQRWFEVQKWVMTALEQDIGSRNAYFLLGLYWLSPLVRKNGDQSFFVKMQDEKSKWLALCQDVQRRMKQMVHEGELVVEVNPSSNRVIGPMVNYRQHHVFNLTLDENRQHLTRYVRAAVCTDNPAVCNTTLAHEYYLLGEILIGEGIPEPEVSHWLEWLRSNSDDYNFARRLRTIEEDPDMASLNSWLRSIPSTVREAPSRSEKHAAFWKWWREQRLRDHGFSRKAIESHPEVAEATIALMKNLRFLEQQQRRLLLDRLTGNETPSDHRG